MNARPEIALIVARARNGVIGRDNTLPWRLRDDLQLFKQRTLGCPVIMGRKTWESLGKPLPGRINIVISRQPAFCAEGAVVVHSMEEAVDACQAAERAFVIGGAQIYAQWLQHADVLWMTEVAADVAGDTCFPELPPGRYREVSRQHFAADARNDYSFDVVEYRAQPAA
ncbi:MAG: dihydrofolate reductase [Uliginosibacterium sp.]|jgi:dihydrofolate reductase|nr:dihydrofolate reductase [Uliginosibacterium sp.]MBK9616851.1 dihydrofolate reductase [Uliginosibacterium sp.]